MIHEIGVELQAALRAQGCPFVVVDREPAQTSTGARERIVIEHDGKDAFSSVRSQHINPKHRLTRSIGVKLTIYAQSVKAGALEFEHRRRAEAVLDLVLVALDGIARTRRNAWRATGGGFIVPEDLATSERLPGAAYELTFLFDRGVSVRSWAGEIMAEADLTPKVMTGGPLLVFDAADDTITRDAGSWIADGFVVGDRIRVRGSTSNNVTNAAIAIVTADAITLDATALADEGPIAGCTVTAGGILSTTKVSRAHGPDDDDDDTTVPATAETACGG